LIYYQKTLQIEQWLDDKVSIAQTTENIGIAHYYRGNSKVAMSYFLSAAVLFYKIKEFQLLNRTIVSISSIISDLGYHQLSIKLHQTALYLAIKYDNLRIMSTCYNNIGFSYSNLENYNKALEYLNYSIEIKEILGDKEGMLITLGVMGSVYQAQERYALSNKIYTDIIKISEEIDDKRQVAIGLTYIGENLAKQQEYSKAINYYHNSLELLVPLKAMNEIRDNYLYLAFSTYHLYDFAKTAKYYKQYKAYCDSTAVF
jgi:tetratricopeptide (TPR) repeat protein